MVHQYGLHRAIHGFAAELFHGQWVRAGCLPADYFRCFVYRHDQRYVYGFATGVGIDRRVGVPAARAGLPVWPARRIDYGDVRGLVRGLGAEFLQLQRLGQPHADPEYRRVLAKSEPSGNPTNYEWDCERGMGIL